MRSIAIRLIRFATRLVIARTVFRSTSIEITIVWNSNITFVTRKESKAEIKFLSCEDYTKFTLHNYVKKLLDCKRGTLNISNLIT